MREKIREKKTVDYQSPSLAGENSIMQDVTRDRRPKGRCSWVEREMQPGGKGDAAGWRGRCSRVERETQLGGEGDAAGWRGRCSWVEREKGSGRTVGRPGQAVTPPCALSSRTGRMENQLICVCISDYAVYISFSCRMV